MEKILVEGEFGDDDLGDGVAFLLNLVGTLDPTCVELNWAQCPISGGERGVG